MSKETRSYPVYSLVCACGFVVSGASNEAAVLAIEMHATHGAPFVHCGVGRASRSTITRPVESPYLKPIRIAR